MAPRKELKDAIEALKVLDYNETLIAAFMTIKRAKEQMPTARDLSIVNVRLVVEEAQALQASYFETRLQRRESKGEGA